MFRSPELTISAADCGERKLANVDFSDAWRPILALPESTARSKLRRHVIAAQHLVRRRPMYFVAALLVVLTGLFYAAGHHEIGSLGVEMCRYGSTFCDSPIYVLAGAALAALWAAFVSIR
jgi:hypothetical protein